MKKCANCSKIMKELKSKTPEGISYNYYRCSKCGEEIVDMKQLHELANDYRTLKKYTAKMNKWGDSLGIRIPKELAKQYGLKNDKTVTLIPEKEGIKIILA